MLHYSSMYQEYEKPLLTAKHEIINRKAIRLIFYKVRDILQCHNMFHIELAECVRVWDDEETIGNIFTASVKFSLSNHGIQSVSSLSSLMQRFPRRLYVFQNVVFYLQFSKCIVSEAYSEFVNNFSVAMETAKKQARTKQLFSDFLKVHQSCDASYVFQLNNMMPLISYLDSTLCNYCQSFSFTE